MKRALIIAYYWPPAGGPGVQRWLNFVKYLKEFGVEPVVYVPEDPHYPITDESLSLQIPEELTVIKHPISEPYRFAKFLTGRKTKQISSGIIAKKNPSLLERLLLFIRGNFFIPDARIGWVGPSVKFLSDYLTKNPVDVIITTGPPHSMHLIGMKLKEAMDIAWIADFRDPWTSIHYHDSLQLTKASEKKHKKLESEVLNTADRVVVTSPSTKTEFESLTDTLVKLITNGYDASEEIVPILDAKFSLAHIGSLLSERNPVMLWEVLSEIIQENKRFAEAFQLLFAGAVSQEVLTSISTFGLSNYCKMLGYVSHREARQLQHNAQLLLLLEMDRTETRGILPGKLFEYMAAKRPIIALGPKGSDMEKIISETEAGVFFLYSEKKALKSLLLDHFEMYEKGILEVASKGISKYSRRELTREMASLITSL